MRSEESFVLELGGAEASVVRRVGCGGMKELDDESVQQYILYITAALTS